ncbi:facilitated trehalose transporter Tret1-like [Aricia agestis]|uniref:facilitated trehalose transporter Tret1-like n=1 Tax=Aricia agestis TaxID=91739 RepID=UPI001C20223D|nr:facilitated trehalose transporter Tret1-like [Aricia agestis]
MKYYGVFSEGSKVNQVLCAILINIPVFSYGTCVGWMSPMSLLLQSDRSPRETPLTDVEISWMAAVPYVVCVCFDFLIAEISDKFGRKFATIFMSCGNIASWGLLLICTDFWALILARAIIGISMAGSFVTCPMYTKEISDDSIRGSLGCLVILFQTSGNLFLYVIGDIFDYYTILWICIAIPVVHILLFLYMPESPSYLIKKKQNEKAIKALAWLKCKGEMDSDVTREVDLITKEQASDEKPNSFLLKTMLSDKLLRRVFTIAMVVTLAREVCGAVPVLNFAGDIFAFASSDSAVVFSPNQQAMILGAVQVIGSVLASSVVEKTGRKSLLFISSLLSGLSMCALASWFLLRDFNIGAPSWIPLLTLCLCIFCDASGLQPISVVLCGEICSYKYRSTVMAVTMATSSLADFVQLLLFKPLANVIGIHVAFYFFGGICLLMAVYVIFQIPETKARSLEDIYRDLSKDAAKKAKEKEAEATVAAVA